MNAEARLAKQQRLEDRSVAAINRGARFLLKSSDGCYVDPWSCLARGEDGVSWCFKRNRALEFNDLQTAHAVRRMFKRAKVKVVIAWPKERRDSHTVDV